MEILSVNLNKYSGLEDIVMDDINTSSFSYVLVNGEESIFERVRGNLETKVIYVGFSPLVTNELVGLCLLLYDFSSDNKSLRIKSYEEENIVTRESNPLVTSLIGFFNASDMNSTVFYTSDVAEKIISYYRYFPHFIDAINPYFDFNKIIYSLYTTSLGGCRYKDMDASIFHSLKNDTVYIKLHRTINREYGKHPDFQALISDLERYNKLASEENLQALMFYIALFVNSSVFNKNRREFSISYLYLQRAIEVALTFHFLDSGVLEINEYDKFSFKGDSKSIMGVGDLIKEYFRVNKDPQLKIKILKLNTIRNRSSLAHGLYVPSSEDYDELYHASLDLINRLISNDDDRRYYKRVIYNLKPVKKEFIKERILIAFGN